MTFVYLGLIKVAQGCTLTEGGGGSLAPSPPPQLSSLAVRITRRRPGINYHVMYATDVIT